MDNITFPSVMAWQLYEHGISPGDTDYTYDQVRRSLGYIAANGGRRPLRNAGRRRPAFRRRASPPRSRGSVVGAALAVAEADRIEAGNAGVGSGPDADPDSLRADALAWLALADDWTTRVEEVVRDGHGH